MCFNPRLASSTIRQGTLVPQPPCKQGLKGDFDIKGIYKNKILGTLVAVEISVTVYFFKLKPLIIFIFIFKRNSVVPENIHTTEGYLVC